MTAGLAATRYDLIAREGTVEQARTMLRNAGLLNDPAEPTLPDPSPGPDLA